MTDPQEILPAANGFWNSNSKILSQRREASAHLAGEHELHLCVHPPSLFGRNHCPKIEILLIQISP